MTNLEPLGSPLAEGALDVATVAKGTSAAELDVLVATHSGMVYRLAVAIVHDRSLAEDVVQEVMFKAWQSLPDQTGDTPVRWLRTVTRNTAIDVLRRRRFDDVTHEPPEPAVTPVQPDRIVEGLEHVDALWAALGSLDVEARTMLALREAEFMSYDEIAVTLDTTVSAVKAKLYRARHQLRQALRDWSDA